MGHQSLFLIGQLVAQPAELGYAGFLHYEHTGTLTHHGSSTTLLATSHALLER